MGFTLLNFIPLSGVIMLSILISAFLFIGCGGKDADSGTETEEAAAAEE